MKNSIRSHQGKRASLAYYKENFDLYLFILPAFLVTLIFSYIPMYGIQIAFKNFSSTKGIFGSDWVGLKYFIRFFSSSYFGEILGNTLIISFYSLIVGFPIPIILALLLNQMNNGKYRKIIQTVTYAPNFISTVVICGMILLFLSPRSGFINKIIEMFGGTAVNFMSQPDYFSSIYVLTGVWQSAGWGSIIYLAALSGVSPELHEAAVVDGANKFQRIWHIDIPGIIPTAVIMLILSMGSIMSVGFEKAYLLQNDLNGATSEIISTYVYKVGLQDNQLSFSTAVGLFNSVVNMILLIVVNAIARRVNDTSLW